SVEVPTLAASKGRGPRTGRSPTAEASKGLGELESDIAARQNEEMLRDAVQFKGLDVRHRPRSGEAGDWVNPRAGARADHDDFAAKGARTVVGRHLDRSRPDKAALPFDQLRAALSIRIDINSDNAIDHLPLAVADGWHLDFPVASGDAELGASAEIVGDLGTVDHVLARGASDGRAGSREIPSLDDRHALPLRGQRPGEKSGPPATEHHHVVFLGMRHVFPLRVNSSR